MTELRDLMFSEFAAANIPAVIDVPAMSPMGYQEAYKLAQITSTNKTWQPTAIAGDSATRESIELGLPRSREQAYNNGQYKSAKEKFVDLIVGPGVQAYSEPFSPNLDIADDELDFDLSYAFESDSWFERWADDKKQCDAEGKLPWWDMQRLSVGDVPVAGDVLLLRVNKKGPGRIIPLCYQILEREQLDKTMDRPAEPGQTKIVNGIELDEFEAPIAYWIFDAHPDDHFYSSSASSRSRRIPADRVIHAYIPFRPSMNIGFPWFHAIAQTSRDRHWLVGSELTKAAIGALLTIIHYTNHPGSTISLEDGEDGADSFGNALVKLATGGNSMRLKSSDKVEMFNPNTPAQQLPGFIDVLDHDQAAGVGLSHLRFTGRWANLSYTAGRGAQLDDEQHFRPLKNWWGRTAVLPVRQAVNSQMIAAGKITTITERKFLVDLLRWQSFFIMGPGREYLDPEGESDSAKSKLSAGLSTLRDELAKQGLHWVKVLRQIRLENRIIKKFGVQLDFSKGGGQQAGSRIAGESTGEKKERATATTGGRNAAKN
jgi:lambda family phage portal protein